MTVNGNAIKTDCYMIDAWQVAQEPDAIDRAARIGQRIADLLIEAAILVQRAHWNINSIIKDPYIRCQKILDRLTSEADRLTPLLARLRAASKAVIS